MLRIVSFVVAVAAMLAMPFSQADARGRMGGCVGAMHIISGHVSSFRSVGGPRVGSFNTFRSANVIGSRKVIISNHRIHHRRGYPFFVGVGAYGLYDTCWRWVPSVYGYRR